MTNELLNIFINDAIPDDAGDLLDMVQELAAWHGEHAALTLDQIDDLVFGRNPACRVFMVRQDGLPAGFAAGYIACELQNGQRVFELQTVLIRFRHRRRGAGRALIRGVAQRLAREGVRTIKLGARKTNWAARAFYAKLGFTEKDAGPSSVRLVLRGRALERLIAENEEDDYWYWRTAA